MVFCISVLFYSITVNSITNTNTITVTVLLIPYAYIYNILL